MKPLRSSPPLAKDPVSSVTPVRESWLRSWTRFWFAPTDAVGLHVVRLLTGLLLLAWLLPSAGHVQELYGMRGWFDQQAYEELFKLEHQPPTRPGEEEENRNPMQPLGWSVLFQVGSNPLALTAVYWGSIAVLVLFTLGIWTRLTSVLTWVIVASFTTGPAISYDGDVLLVILSLYLMVGYLLLHQRTPGQSLAARLLGSSDTLFLGLRSRPRPSIAANLALRLLQVHLAIVVVTSGLHKLQMGEWWAGVALWYPLHPAFETTVAQARSSISDPDAYLFFLSIGAYAALAWQLTFPLFAWRPRWRALLLGGAAVSWLGLIFIYRLPLLGPALFIGCLGFVSPEGWHRLFDAVARRLPAGTGARRSAAVETANREQTSPVALGNRS